MSSDLTTWKDNLNKVEIPIEKLNLAIGNAIEKGKKVKQNTIEPTKGKRFWRKSMWKKVAFSVCGFSLLIGTLVAVNPSVQALATDIMSKIFSEYKFVIKNGIYVLEKRNKDGVIEEVIKGLPIESVKYDSVKDVEEQIGMSLTLPSYLPNNTELKSISGSKSKNIPFATFHYKTNSDEWLLTIDSSLSAKRVTRQGLAYNEKIKVDETIIYVGKHPRVSFDESTQEPLVEYVNKVDWSGESGVLYDIRGDIPLEEMKKVALSIVKEK